MNVDIFFDGSCKNVKQDSSPMGLGIAVFIDNVYDEELSRSVFRWEDNERGTNNVAEWNACIIAMKTAYDIRKSNKDAKIRVYSDSQIISNQYNGTYTANGSFTKYCVEARKYGYLAFVRIITWIPREQNKQADELAGLGRRLDKEKFELFQQREKQKQNL